MRIDKNTVVFITGGLSGLGWETMNHLHTLGAKVAIADLDTDGKMVAEYSARFSLEDGYLFLACDVSKESEVKSAVENTVAIFGRIDVAVACAGVIPMCYTIDSNGKGFDSGVFQKVMAINLLGPAYVAKHAAVAMVNNAP